MVRAMHQKSALNVTVVEGLLLLTAPRLHLPPLPHPPLPRPPLPHPPLRQRQQMALRQISDSRARLTTTSALAEASPSCTAEAEAEMKAEAALVKEASVPRITRPRIK